MKRILSLAAVLVLAMSAISVPVYAFVKADDRIIVRADEVVDDDIFAAGEEFTVEGTVNGDIYVGAQRVNIRGTVNGDVIAGAQTIEVTGVIRDDLRAGGNNISLVGATIGDSVTVAGNELSIDGDTKIGGGLVFGGRSLTLTGSVGRGIISGNETTRIDGPVAKNVRVAANDILIDQDAVIAGDLYYQSDNQPVIEGTVVGQVVQSEGGGLDLDTESLLRGFAVGFTVWAFIASAIIGGVMLLLTPKILPKAYERFTKKPWPTVGWGAVVLLATIPAVILMFITIFGIPLGILTLVFWMTFIYLAKIFVAFAVGSWLFKYFRGKEDKTYRPNSYLALLVGLLLYYGLRILPVLGPLIRVSTTIVGLGMIVTLFAISRGRAKPKTKAKSA